MQPRLTARLVVPTPPVAPRDGDHVLPRLAAVAAAELPLADPIEGGDQVFDLDRLGEELLGPGPHRPQDQLAVGRAADDEHAALGRDLADLLDQLEAFFGICVDRDDADVGLGLADDVGEELVARALGFEPDHVHAQQHVLDAHRERSRWDRRWLGGGRCSCLANQGLSFAAAECLPVLCAQADSQPAV